MDFTLDDIRNVLQEDIRQILQKELRVRFQIELQPIKEDLQTLKNQMEGFEDRFVTFQDYTTRSLDEIKSDVTVIRNVQLPRVSKAIVSLAHTTSVQSPEIQELESGIYQ